MNDGKASHAPEGSLRLLLCPGARVPGEKKRPRARGVVDLVRRSSRSEQKRFTGCVMTEECPCSPREATLGASPRRRTAAGRGFFHPPTETPRRKPTAERARGARREHEPASFLLRVFERSTRTVAAAFAMEVSRRLCEREDGKAETVRRARNRARPRPMIRGAKKKTSARARARVSSGVRRGQDRNESQAA